MPAIEGLYALTPDCPDTGALLTLVASALEGGAHVVQYRAKRIEPIAAAGQAGELAQLCRRHGVPLIVNDDLALAVAVGADGVHLGRDDASVADARRVLAPGAIVGVSC